MLLLALKIISTLITTGLAVFAVMTDFRNKKNGKLKKSGKWYIAIFLCSVGLSFVFDRLSGSEQKQEMQKNFISTSKDIRSATEKLLQQTKDSLNIQFSQLNKLNDNINRNLNKTAKDIQSQLIQTSINQKATGLVIKRINDIAIKTNANLNNAIASIDTVGLQERNTSDKLSNLYSISSQNLSSILEVTKHVTTLTEPLTPICLVFRIKYKVDKLLVPSAIKYNPGKSSATDLPGYLWIYQSKRITSPSYPYYCHLINLKEITRQFYENFYLGVSFYKDSTCLEKTINYVDCGMRYRSSCTLSDRVNTLFFNVRDTAIVREYRIYFYRILDNDAQVKNLSDLLERSVIRANGTQSGNLQLKLEFEEFGGKKYENIVSIKEINFEPFLRIEYGEGFRLKKEFKQQNFRTIPQKDGQHPTDTYLTGKL